MKIPTNEVVLFHDEARPEPMVMVKKFLDKTVLPASEVSPELFRAKGTWPFDLFPDELIIEVKRIVIKRNYFPFVSTVSTIPINNLLVFELTHSLFFSSLYIREAYGDNLNTTFCWLSHKDAQKAKDLVDGLRLKETEAIEVVERDRGKLSLALRILGHA